MRFRSLSLGLTALAIIYSGLWYTLALDAKKTVATQLRDLRNTGLSVSYSESAISGFPYRMIVTLDKLDIRSKRGGVQFAARGARLISHVWTPGDWMILADDMAFSVAGKALVVTDTSLRGRWTLHDAKWVGSLELNDARFVKAPGLHGAATAEILQLHVQREIGRTAEDAPSEGLYGDKIVSFNLRMANLMPEGGKKISLKRGEILGSLTGAGLHDWTADTLGEWRDAGGLLDIEAIAANWRGSEITGSGSLTFDHALRPMGSFGIKSTDHGLLLDHFAREGWGSRSAIKAIKAEIAASRPEALSLNLQDGSLRLEGYQMMKLPVVAR